MGRQNQHHRHAVRQDLELAFAQVAGRVGQFPGFVTAGQHVAGQVVDHVVVCAGQESERSVFDALDHPSTHLIGGADVAAELDAKRAIEQGTRVAAAL